MRTRSVDDAPHGMHRADAAGNRRERDVDACGKFGFKAARFELRRVSSQATLPSLDRFVDHLSGLWDARLAAAFRSIAAPFVTSPLRPR